MRSLAIVRHIFLTTLVALSYFQVFGQNTGNVNPQDTALNRHKAPGLINSDQYTEFAPSISADGKTMIIESNRNGSWKLFQSNLQDNGNWSEPISIDKINYFGDSSDLIGGPSISYDGNRLYFFSSNKNGYGSEDIYYSEREGNNWGVPNNIGSQINSADYEGFPSVSSDGKTIYFTKIKKGYEDKNFNETCYVIYSSKKDANGNWLAPEPLPYPVNFQCDKAPRIMADNRTLIFSSYRPGTKGGYDLYQSQVDDDGEWSTPVPLTFVNTTQDDMFACISASGDVMYYNTGGDIWSVTIPQHLRQFKNIIMQGYVKDADSQHGLGVKIKITDASTSEEMFTIDNNAEDGRYSVVMAAGRTYNVVFYKDGYSSEVYSYDLRSRDAYDVINQNVTLFKTVHLRLNVFDKELFEPLPGNIKVVNENTGNEIPKNYFDTEPGYTILNLPIGATYKITVDLKNFSSQSFTFNINRQVIYREFERDVELVPDKINVPINVSDITNSSNVKGKVIIRNKSRDEVIEVNSNEMVALRVGDRYEIEATSDKGYFFASTTVEVTTSGIQQVETQTGATSNVSAGEINMKLAPITSNATLDLKEILFESGSAQLSEVSYQELDRLVQVMKSNPTMRAEISAYTDDVGTEVYNQGLSERRAQSVVDYLVTNNIPKTRFVARGYGETRPKYPNDSDKNRAKNRRVELKVLEVLN